MKPNIFIIGYDTARGDEDIVTAYWSYALNTVPGLGQAFANDVSRRAGLPKTRFVGALDHPAGDAANHPDLLLQCKDWQLLFEHKVDAPLGPRQLHRYLRLAEERGWKLGLMAAEPVSLDPDILDSPSYVCPASASHPRHFLWSDLLPLLRQTEHHLATEFAEFLEHRGLGAFSWGGRGDPFFDDAARAALLHLYEPVGKAFRAPGVRCSFHAKSLIYKISSPHPAIHLLNFGPLRSVAQHVPNLRGPVMGAWFWIRRSSPRGRRLLAADRNGPLRGANLPITVWNSPSPTNLPYAKEVFDEREYYVSLDAILVDDPGEASARLVSFVRAALGDVTRELDRR